MTMNFKEKQMTKKRWAILLIAVSIPLSYYGFSNFEAGSSDPLEAIAISIGCTGGLGFFFGGIYMFFTKAKGRGENLLASQTKVGDSPIQKTINKKVNEMAKADTSVDLMKREKELETRRKELESLLAEVTKEEKAVEKELLSKGWVQKNGSWGIK
tara:strand:+ start:11 stop:478 length:468 start_codon:yes stop_codon:yes gene_type:complete